jgi:hypothetical protein
MLKYPGGQAMNILSIHKRSRDAVIFVAAVFVLLFPVKSARAFALMGPYADWMTITNGYQRPFDIGGPMNIGEGYRWNVPTVTYAFDPTFVNAFGTNGIAAVENAIAILNSLPPASQLDPNNFPLYAIRLNIRAAAQSLYDLKSTTLFLLLQQLGLTGPTRYTSALHDFSVTGGLATGNFLQRNFDPFSLAPTNAVNGIQYFPNLYYGTFDGKEYAGWTDFPLDPQDSFYTAISDQMEITPGSPGQFASQLTRDDAGGLRYLLRPDHYAFETLLPDVHGAGTNLNSYVDLALRAGVDKIIFVRQDYDALTGEAYVPLTNDFIDAYMTNNTLVHQQLERIISKPDFVFSAFEPIGNISYTCTDASNWLNNSRPNGSADGEGPGTIRPQVNISFQKYGLANNVQTEDGLPPNAVTAFTARWASFDDSTNPPAIFADSDTSQINDMDVVLSMLDTNSIWIGGFIWNLPISYGESATLQTSANLVDWVSETTITNYGLPMLWTHLCTAPQGFFRVVPQTNSP